MKIAILVVLSLSILTAAANRCQPLPLFEGGTFNVTGLNAGDSAIYSCDPARKLIGEKVLKCESGGQWSSAPPRCVVVDCGILSEVTNGRFELLNGSTTLSSVAVYSCDENYKLNGTNTTICQENGSWSGILPNCALIDCQTPPDVRNGFVLLVNGTTTFGSMAMYLCAPGFTPRDTFVRGFCTASGEWSGSVPDCAREKIGIWFWMKVGFGIGVPAVTGVLVLARMWKRKQWSGPCYGQSRPQEAHTSP